MGREFTSLNEEVDYWFGYLCICLGKGEPRTAISLMLMDARKRGYEAGFKAGMKAKKT